MAEESLFDVVVKRAGGVTALADALSESVQTVSNWRGRGFPANRCKAIEQITGVSVTLLRPDDWRDYWPELTADSELPA